MQRNLTAEQFANVRAQATKPVYLVQIEHAGYMECFANIEDAAFDGYSYVVDGMGVSDIQDQVSATITLFATPERINHSISGAWRNGKKCRIYVIPDSPGSEPSYIVSAAFMVFDGTIDSSRWRGSSISVTAIPKNTSELYTPRNNFSEISSILPAAESTFEWEGATYILTART